MTALKLGTVRKSRVGARWAAVGVAGGWGVLVCASANTLIGAETVAVDPEWSWHSKSSTDIEQWSRAPAGSGAADDDETFTRRFYVGLMGAGVSRLKPRSFSGALTVADDSDSGFHVYGGYDLTRWFSAEVYFADVGEAVIDFLGTPVGEVGYQVYGLNAVGYLINSRSGFGLSSDPGEGLWRREGLSLYVTAGLGGLSNDSDIPHNKDYNLHVSFGTGLEYGFSSGIAVRADLTSYDTDVQYASLSVLKRFGDVSAVASLAPVPKRATPVAPAPADVAPQPPAEPVLVLTNSFAFDSAELSDESRQLLDAIVLVEQDADSMLLVEGHTDSVGTEAYNQGLSERRAGVVYDYLVAAGIDASRVTTRGFGETRPISTNQTPEGRADNRRTEVLKR